MTYTCQNCGVSADDSTSLCNPTTENLDTKLCGVPAEEVCTDKQSTMRFTCDTCGSVSADAEHLCNPSEMH